MGFDEKKSSTTSDKKAAKLIPLLMALKVVLKAPQSLENAETHPQIKFVAMQGIACLVAVLKNKEIAKNQQTLYVCGFCVWLLTFNDRLMESLKTAEIVTTLVEIVQSVTREKVVRICFSCLQNLLLKDADTEPDEEEKEKNDTKVNRASAKKSYKFAEDMVGQQLHKVVQGLMSRKWKDTDLTDSMRLVDKRLRVVLRKLSSFEMYTAEALSGKLNRRSPVHTEDFWRSNFREFEGRNWRFVRKIISFLDEKKYDDETLEMACFDLGEFARFHPDGRRVIKRLHGKSRVMMLMNSDNSGVAKQALLCIQKIMLKNWEELNKSAKAGLSSLGRRM